MSEDFFTYEVCEKLDAYVYRLVDPRNDETFYVGKGRGNRVFQHAIEASVTFDGSRDLLETKLGRIREIQSEGHRVTCIIHRHGMSDDVAFEVESALIDAYPSLRNAVRGHHASDRGIHTVSEIQYRHNLPAVDLSPDDKLLLIKINKIKGGRDKDEIYNLVRYCWPLNSQRAQKAEYVLAVDRGVVIAAYVADQWLSAIPSNFPEIDYCDGSEAHRWGFRGRPAPEEIVTRYVGSHGKRIANMDLTSQAAVRYWQC